MAKEYAEKIKAIFMLVSAKGGHNINEFFNTVVEEYLEQEYPKQIQELKPIKQIEQSIKKIEQQKKRIEESEAEMKELRKKNKNMKIKKIMKN